MMKYKENKFMWMGTIDLLGSVVLFSYQNQESLCISPLTV